MLIYSDHLTTTAIREAFAPLARDGVWLELHGPFGSRKRAARFVVKLSADPGRDRYGTKRRWANTGQWGAATPDNGYVGEPMGEKAATFDEWGLFISRLFDVDPGAIIGVYGSRADLDAAWSEPATVS